MLTLRTRQDMERKNHPWHLRYLGQCELGDKNRATMVRSCIDVAASPNIGQFLTEMGFKLQYSFLMRGYLFKKGRMKVIVGKCFRQIIGSEALEPLTQSYLIEVSVVAPSGQYALADEIKAFCDQLKPLVQMEKVDPRRL